MALDRQKSLPCTDMSSLTFFYKEYSWWLYRILSRERSYYRDKELNWNKRREKGLGSEKHFRQADTEKYIKIINLNRRRISDDYIWFWVWGGVHSQRQANIWSLILHSVGCTFMLKLKHMHWEYDSQCLINTLVF